MDRASLTPGLIVERVLISMVRRPVSERGYTLFDTPIGRCGLAWVGGGVVAVQLPEGHDAATVRRLLSGAGPGDWAGSAVQEPNWPPQVSDAVGGIQALLGGEPRDLRDVVLDMGHVSPFQQRVYALAREIGPGQTCTYGDLARELGDVGLARAVGQALGHNPFAPVVPCHRVLAAGQRAGGFSAQGGTATKLHMLAIEGVGLGGTRPLFDSL